MITLPELLEDKRYRKFFCTVPNQGPQAMNWRIIIRREPDGPWAKKDYAKYSEAFRRIAQELKKGTLHDGALQSRGIAYGPPERIVRLVRDGRPVKVKTSSGALVDKTAVALWKPRLDPHDEEHTWCTYCRRPVVFRWFAKHRSLRNSPVEGCTDPVDRRCLYCGAREQFIHTSQGSAARPGATFAPSGKRRRR